MNTTELAKMLLKNTKETCGEWVALKHYISLTNALKRITQDGYNVSDFSLCDIDSDASCVFCTGNGSNLRCFEVFTNELADAVEDTSIGYLDKDNNLKIASNIEEAMQKYKTFD